VGTEEHVPDCSAGVPEEFFRELWRPGEGRFTDRAGSLVLEFRVWPDGNRRGRADCFHFRSLDECLESLRKLDGQPETQNGKGCFFGVQPRSGRPKSGGSNDDEVREAHCVFTDFDGKDFAPGSEGKAAAWDAVNSVPIQPSTVIDSGNGFHAYWFLAEPWAFGDPEVHAEVHYGFALAHGADLAVRNSSRVLRVPGSFWLKDPDDPRLVRIVRWEPERRYDIDEFLDYRRPLPTPAKKQKTDFVDLEEAPDVTSLPIHPFYRTVIEAGDDPKCEEWRNADGSLDRSRRDYSVIKALLRREIDPSTIRAIFQHHAVGDKYAEKGDRYLSLTIGNAARALEERIELIDGRRGNGEHNDTAEPGVWEAPVPLTAGHRPPFPVDALSDWHAAWVRATAAMSQTPPDLAAGMSLACISAAVARKYRIQTHADHSEPLNLYILVVLPPGSRKSSVTAAAGAPITEYEKELAAQMGAEIAEAVNEQKILQERGKHLQKLAAKAKPEDREALEEQARRAVLELEAHHVRVVPRLLADDVTPEKLGGLLASNGGRLAIVSAEGGFFETLAGRYSDKGVSNIDLVLKAHSGDDVRVDRVGRPPEFVRRPALTLGMAVQPDVMRGLSLKPGFRGRGMLGRLGYSLPENTLGRRDPNPPPLPRHVAREYHDRLWALLELKPDLDADGEEKEHVLRLSPRANERFIAFGAWLEPQLSEYGELGHMTDWAGKLQGLVGRLAGLLHLSDHAGVGDPASEAVSLETIERAIRIGEYFLAHAVLAFGELGVDEETEDARYLLGWIREKQLERVSQRDIHRSTRRGRFKAVEDLQIAIALLVKHGYLRKLSEEKKAGPGRKQSPEYEVNPALYVEEEARSVDTEPASDSGDSGDIGHHPIEADSDHFGDIGDIGHTVREHNSAGDVEHPEPDPGAQYPQNPRNGEPGPPEEPPIQSDGGRS